MLSPEEFAEAMRAAVADPSNAATPGDAPDVIAYDPDVLAAEGGGDDPDACADHVGEGGSDDRPLTGVSGLISSAWRATWLADEFRKAGLVVVEVEGWKTRGYDFPDSPVEEGVSIFHHTASNRNSGPAGGLRIVTYGREGLAGPIANWLTARNGIVYVVAAGVANNAGQGNARAAGLPNTTGNSNTLANEMENDGLGEAYSPAQRTASLIAHAVVHRKMGWSAGRGIGHLEWSTSGKIDPYVKTWGSMSAARTQLAKVIEGEIVQEDDMDPTTPVPRPNNIPDYLGTFTPSLAYLLHGTYFHLTDFKKQQIVANAADATRDTAALAAVNALAEQVRAGGGNVDTAAIVTAIREEAERTRADVEAQADERLREVAEALMAAAPPAGG